MYTDDSINEVKSRADIVSVIEGYLTLKKNGASFISNCPFHDEKTPSFHVHPAKEIFKCFGCGAAGDSIAFVMKKDNCSYPEAIRVLADKYNVTLVTEGTQVYKVPTHKLNLELSENIYKWFQKRKISGRVLKKLKVSEGVESMPVNKGFEDMNTIQFNYFRDGVLMNTKYRGKDKENGKKTFKLVPGAELMFYNLDSLKGKKEAFIVEGCPDVLALVEANIDEEYGVIGVPNGASIGKNNLIYLNNCLKEVEHIEKWHLGLDNDTVGRKLRDELADRLGKYKCDYIEWKDKKDANDVLIAYDIKGVRECCLNPVKFPLEGAFTISDFSYDIDDMWQNGLDRGVGLGLKDFPLRFVRGYITVITGISGMGKSEATDEMCLRLTMRHGWKGAFYSPENKPTQLHYSKMARRLVGKAWDGVNRVSKEEDRQCRDYLENKIWFIKPEKDFSLTSILSSIRDLQVRHGLDYFVIDAWNKLTHKSNDVAEIEKALNELALFCEVNNLHCFLVAHPKKPDVDRKTGKVGVPKLWDIAGSNNFNNKADNGISIHVDRETKTSTWYLLKVKFSHWGWISESNYKWEPNSGRYYKEGYPDFTNWITGKVNVTPNSHNELPLENGVTIREDGQEGDAF